MLGDDLVEAKRKTKEEIFFIIDQIKKNKKEILLLREKKSLLEAEMKKEQELKNSPDKRSRFSLINGFKSLFSDQKGYQEIQSLS